MGTAVGSASWFFLSGDFPFKPDFQGTLPFKPAACRVKLDAVGHGSGLVSDMLFAAVGGRSFVESLYLAASVSQGVM